MLRWSRNSRRAGCSHILSSGSFYASFSKPYPGRSTFETSSLPLYSIYCFDENMFFRPTIVPNEYRRIFHQIIGRGPSGGTIGHQGGETPPLHPCKNYRVAQTMITRRDHRAGDLRPAAIGRGDPAPTPPPLPLQPPPTCQLCRPDRAAR